MPTGLARRLMDHEALARAHGGLAPFAAPDGLRDRLLDPSATVRTFPRAGVAELSLGVNISFAVRGP